MPDGKAAENPANLANEERFERTDELQDIEAIKVCQSMVESIVEKSSHTVSHWNQNMFLPMSL